MTIKVMLAAKCEDLSKLLFPLLASPKLDGVRAIVEDGVVKSRTDKPIPNKHVQKLFGKKIFNGLDGELIVGSPTASDVYRKTTSGVMTQEGEPNVWFYVFDDYLQVQPFKYRTLSVNRKDKRIIPCQQYHITKIEDLLGLEAYKIDAGYEGLILRNPEAPYKFGRSTFKEQGMVKLKRFVDSEAVILEILGLMQNNNEAKINSLGKTERSSHKANKVMLPKMGALKVRDIYTDVEFDIGTGFDDEERKKFWDIDYVGKIVKYKYLAVGVKDKPRHPVFLGFREDI